ncbi:MAG: TonB-dependent receptor plug domain-containing protein [Opitutaceae bacterium]|nr:TonB-dependent receptor plug domain-containing protein [Opitutaceae bacterium]
MKPKTHQATAARRTLAVSLAALMAAPFALGQSGDAAALRRLQEENAALRRQLAEAQAARGATAPTITPAASPASAPAARAGAPALATDEGVQVLSPFEVKSDKDYGYLKTNAVSATKIGMEIQNIPLNISVISREFLDDTNSRSLTDLFRYTAATSGDTRFAMRVPANSATPQGSFTSRGFVVNSLMRNGIFRYTSYNLENIERVEFIKGPAAVFFGQGYPGGVINYISKLPEFGRNATGMDYAVNSNSGQKVNLDHNAALGKNAALRIVGTWEDTQGERRFEFRRSNSFNPSVAMIPFASGKVKITAEAEFIREKFSWNDFDWIFSDFSGWRNAAATGAFGSSTATLSNTIVANAGNGLTANVIQSTTTPTLAYATYINNKRIATSDWSLPAYTSVKRGAFYTNAAGQFIHDEAFNYTSRGANFKNTIDNVSLTADMSPFSWLDVRYNYFNEKSENYSVGQGGALLQPYANGVNWSMGTGNLSGYYRYAQTHNIDTVLKFDKFGVKSKLLAGFQRINPYQQFLGGQLFTDAQWAFLPGARNTTSNPDYRGTNVGIYNHGNVPVNQVIRDRNGAIKPVRQIFSNFDPGFEIYPDITVYHQDDRNALDGYKDKQHSVYLNYQATLLNDRLTVLGGYRKERRWARGQYQPNNYPWFIYFPDMHLRPDLYPEDVWGHSINYQRGLSTDQEGNSWMGGASFAVTKELSVYASTSKTFKFNSGRVGGLFVGDEVLWYNEARAFGAGGTPGQSFSYLGQTITSLQQFQQVLAGRGVYDVIKNEQGMNWEVGAKLSKADGRLVGTLSFFRGERENQMLDDGAKQSNLEEPLNFSTTLFPVGSPYRNTRLLRWRTTDLKNRIEGGEAEVIWTPRRNFQAVINGSWLWTAKTVYDRTRAAPGTTAYNALTPAGKVASDIYYKARIENVPEYRFNFFGKYTFTEGIMNGFGRGAMLGLGARYSSKTVVSRAVDWNPLAGGYQAGNYLVFDLTVGYPWELLGYRVHSNFGLYNATDEKYSEGSYVQSPARNWVFRNTLKF